MLEKIVAKAENFDIDKIMGNPVLIVLSIVFLYSPSLFNRLPVISDIDVYIKLVLVMIIFFCYGVFVLKTKHISKFLIIFNVFCLWQFIVTFINKTNDLVGSIWGSWILMNALYCFLEIDLSNQKEKTLKYIFYILSIEMLINFFTVIYKKDVMEHIDDMNGVFFFGNYNGFINVFLPAVFVGYYILLNTNKDKKLNFIFIFNLINIAVSYYYQRSLTSILVMLMVIFYMTFLNKPCFRKILNLRNYFIVTILIFIIFVFIQPDGEFITKIFAVFGKNPTLSSRTPIWRDVIGYIKDNPIIGYGICTNEFRNIKYGYAHSHNMILEKIFTTGLIGLMIYMLLWYLIYKNVFKIQEYKFKGLFSICIFAFLLRCQFENAVTIFASFMMFLFILLAQDMNGIKKENYITLKFLDK